MLKLLCLRSHIPLQTGGGILGQEISARQAASPPSLALPHPGPDKNNPMSPGALAPGPAMRAPVPRSEVFMILYPKQESSESKRAVAFTTDVVNRPGTALPTPALSPTHGYSLPLCLWPLCASSLPDLPKLSSNSFTQGYPLHASVRRCHWPQSALP